MPTGCATMSSSAWKWRSPTSSPGLHNRRYMSRHLDNLVASAKKNGKPIAFVIMDIDYFKAVNDTHGHDIGDEVLKEFASRIAANVRGIDLACRYGGEEFVVVMPDTDVAFAYSVSERLRQSHRDHAVPRSAARPDSLNLTISIGIARLEGENDSADALLHRADQALYRAKRLAATKSSPTLLDRSGLRWLESSAAATVPAGALSRAGEAGLCMPEDHAF